MSRLLGFQIERFKRVSALSVEVTAEGQVFVIRGVNESGKSSALEALATAIGGRRIEPPDVIQDGQIEAKVLVDLDDLLVVRKWRREPTGLITSTLEVTTKDGQAQRSPQAVLDKLIGRLSFDPLHFMALKPAEQAEALRKVVGLDFAVLDAKRLKLYTDRTASKKELDGLEARYAAALLNDPKGEGLSPVDVGALLEQQRQLGATATHRQTLEHRATAAANTAAAAEQLVREAEAAWMKARARAAEAKAASEKAAAELAAAPTVAPLERDQVDQQIRDASSINDRVMRHKALRELAGQVEAARQAVEGQDRGIASIDSEKAAALEGVVFPVPGLAFGSVGVLHDGHPLENASASTKLRVSVAIGIALNPGLRMLTVQGGEKLTKKNAEILRKLAAEHDAIVLMEVAAEDDGASFNGIVIDDGMLARDGRKGAA